MERDYARIRHVETRYRLLFQMSSDAVLIVDDAARRILDSNPTARSLFADAAEPGRAWPLTDTFTPDTARSVDLLLAGVRASGRADDVRARLRDGGKEVVITASLFRDEGGISCLVRIARPAGEPATAPQPKLKAKLLKLMESAPDGFVVTDAGGRVITTNATFLELAQLPTEEQARNELLSRWLGRSGVDLDILMANLRQHGSVRLFASLMRGEFGEPAEVEVSAVTDAGGSFHALQGHRRFGPVGSDNGLCPHSFNRFAASKCDHCNAVRVTSNRLELSGHSFRSGMGGPFTQPLIEGIPIDHADEARLDRHID